MESEVRHGDQHGYIKAERLLHQEQKALAFLLMFSEPVDDQQVSAVELICDLATRPHQAIDIQLAALGTSAEILKQLQLFTSVQQHRRELDIIPAVVSELHKTNDAVSLSDQTVCKIT